MSCCDQDGTHSKSYVLDTELGCNHALEWLQSFVRVEILPAGDADKTDFRIVKSSAGSATCLKEPHTNVVVLDLFREAGFVAEELVVTRHTIDFNIHYRVYSHAPVNDEHLPLWKVADVNVGICWTWHSSARQLRGLIWYFDDAGKGSAEFLHYRLSQTEPAAFNVLLPPLLFLQMQNTWVRNWVDSSTYEVGQCQIATSYHDFEDIQDNGAEMSLSAPDLEVLSKKLCVVAINVMIYLTYLQRLTGLADFIIERCEYSSERSVQPLIERTRSARRTSEGLLLCAERCKHISTILGQTLLSLTTQQDQKLSIELAQSSKVLAEQARGDSRSMVAISAVAMFFLPATYISSLFDLPFFDWDNLQVKPAIRIYWLVTAILTLMVFLIWRWWMNRPNAMLIHRKNMTGVRSV